MIRRLAALAAVLVLAGCGLPIAGADTAVYEQSDIVWAPTRPVVNDANASGGTAVKLSANGAGTMDLPAPVSAVSLRMRGVACWSGEWPKIRVSVGGTVIGLTTVNSTAWTTYPLPVPIGVVGPLKIEMTNAFTGAYLGGTCYRTAFLDTVATESASAPGTTTPSTSTSATETTAPPESGDEYVAMGDSYSSGEGADRTPAQPTRDSSVYAGNSCGRSIHNAQRILAAEHGLDLVDAACGGATTANILTTGLNGEPAQITRLTPATKLVTMTIGGNDTALIYMLTQCVLANGNCTPGNTAGWLLAPSSFYAQTYTKINAVQAKLEAILRQVATRSPDARVVMAGYPYILAGPGEFGGRCVNVVTAAEQVSFADLITRTNTKIQAAVTTVAAETGKDYRYADPMAPTSPFMERLEPGAVLGDGCSLSPDRWMNNGDGQQGAWHPNIDGQARYAELYDQALG